MASVAASGENLVLCCGKNLVGIHIKQDREPFVFDCSKAEQKPKENENKSEDGGPEEKGSDRILAFTFSASGRLLSLTDDNKRLILFRTEPSWECVSTRWVVRRCTSLAFTSAEDQVMAGDKSGDVYSFSVTEPQKAGELRLGHLSMLLALWMLATQSHQEPTSLPKVESRKACLRLMSCAETSTVHRRTPLTDPVTPSTLQAVSPDDRYVVTADRDEKIRVSVLRSPHNIQAFCLGHREFVSCLSIPLAHPHWLFSGSGDGTVRLWEYESGRSLQSCDLKEPSETPATDSAKKSAVCRIAVSPDGRHAAVLCERAPSVQLFRVQKDPEGRLVPGETLTLPHCAWDLTFDPTEDSDLSRVLVGLRPRWGALSDGACVENRFQHLYKVNFDNMASYLQRKQERKERFQQKKQQKREAKKRAGIPQSNGASKKAKAKQTGEAAS
ncbi:hypothetical protein JZ751_012719 [Albula glossodonta]|uniref:WD repeat-containing protein 4 n=1 Tax=Albula glossodonta TaxID=121402 RepID=A0A8T2NA68_9TELE|nr:hypothetical protein JZ751_012719 [Albula glossodonta]